MLYLKRAGWPALFFILLSASVYFYLPALDGPFILDDLANLYGLRFVGSWISAFNYAFHGEAGIRFLSYLSFTPHAASFVGNDAFSFKLVNFLLHGLNAILLFFVSSAVLQQQGATGHNKLISLVIAVIWFIHPIHTGTVLYSVQRMNLLSTLFVIIGSLYHLRFLRQFSINPIAGTLSWVKYSSVLWCLTGLAIISKENGILLLAFIALLNHHLTKARPFKTWQRAITLYSPLVAVLLVLVFDNRLVFGGRNFTLVERLLSEWLILQEYVLKIIIPSGRSFSVFYDDFIPVRSFTDQRFLWACIFWAALAFISKLANRFARGVSFGIAWFLTGHLLESTIIPLELYFDHRNYLPAYGLIFATVIFLHQAWQNANYNLYRLLAILCGLLLTLNLVMRLQQETYYWQTEKTLATSLYVKHPQSLRAHQYLAEAQFRAGLWQESLLTVEKIHQQFGARPSTIIHQITTACLMNPHSTINLERIIADFRRLPLDPAASEAMQNLFRLTKTKQCPALNWTIYQQLLNALLEIPKEKKQTYNLTYMLVLSYIEQNRHDLALAASLALPKSLSQPRFLFLQIDLAIKTGNKIMAESFYRDIAMFDSAEKLIYKNEIAQLDHFMKEYLRER